MYNKGKLKCWDCGSVHHLAGSKYCKQKHQGKAQGVKGIDNTYAMLSQEHPCYIFQDVETSDYDQYMAEFQADVEFESDSDTEMEQGEAVVQ